MARKWLCWSWLMLAGACLAAPDTRGIPARLSDTGLFQAKTAARGAGISEFSPQYPLWSDGAAKRRWIYLPPGEFVDASNPDAWEFPRGTRLWKEFAHGGAIETRYIERGDDGVWRFGSYVWNAAGTEAELAPSMGIRELPAPSAPSGKYAIPAENDCRACHEAAPVPVLGFSALQLSADLRALAASGRVRNLPQPLLAKPPRIGAADPRERAALGYLHGNCGHCHNADGPLAPLDLNLALRASTGFDAGPVRSSVLQVPSQLRAGHAPAGAPRIAPAQFSSSVVALRMRSRDPRLQMPPLGTSVADAHGLALLADWVASLSPTNQTK
jgi:hypothetical protein